LSWHGGVARKLEFFKEEMSARLGERGKGPVHLEVGNHVPELFIEPTQEGKDEGFLTNRIAELGKSTCHGLQPTTVIGNRECSLFEVAELSLKQQGT
jgi:hypothetical protein